jgi:hypothetical protein
MLKIIFTYYDITWIDMQISWGAIDIIWCYHPIMSSAFLSTNVIIQRYTWQLFLPSMISHELITYSISSDIKYYLMLSSDDIIYSYLLLLSSKDIMRCYPPSGMITASIFIISKKSLIISEFCMCTQIS